jgi:hypothetical protein
MVAPTVTSASWSAVRGWARRGWASRGLSVAQAAALSVGAVLGTGVIALPALGARLAGPASLVAWAGLVALSEPLATTFAALGTAAAVRLLPPRTWPRRAAVVSLVASVGLLLLTGRYVLWTGVRGGGRARLQRAWARRYPAWLTGGTCGGGTCGGGACGGGACGGGD